MSSKTQNPKRYAPRVSVWCGNRYLYRTHAAQAEAMVKSLQATADNTGRRIAKIELVKTSSTLATKIGPPGKTHPSQYGTKRAVFFQILGYALQRHATYSFHAITEDDYHRLQSEHEFEVARAV